MKTILTILISGLIQTIIFSRDRSDKLYHTKDGFGNPFAGFEDRAFGDFFQRLVMDKIKVKKPENRILITSVLLNIMAGICKETKMNLQLPGLATKPGDSIL